MGHCQNVHQNGQQIVASNALLKHEERAASGSPTYGWLRAEERRHTARRNQNGNKHRSNRAGRFIWTFGWRLRWAMEGGKSSETRENSRDQQRGLPQSVPGDSLFICFFLLSLLPCLTFFLPLPLCRPPRFSFRFHFSFPFRTLLFLPVPLPTYLLSVS